MEKAGTEFTPGSGGGAGKPEKARLRPAPARNRAANPTAQGVSPPGSGKRCGVAGQESTKDAPQRARARGPARMARTAAPLGDVTSAPVAAANNATAPRPVKKRPVRRRARGPASGRGHDPEVVFTTGPSGNPSGRNCLEFLPPGGTSSCSVTGSGAADSVHATRSKPRVAAPCYAGPLAWRPLPREPRPRASRHPCPWHYLHVSGSHDSLTPTCHRAHLHRRGGGSTPDMASAMAYRNPRATEASGTYTYTYTSRPRAVPCQRRRYRDSLLQP